MFLDDISPPPPPPSPVYATEELAVSWPAYGQHVFDFTEELFITEATKVLKSYSDDS